MTREALLKWNSSVIDLIPGIFSDEVGKVIVAVNQRSKRENSLCTSKIIIPIGGRRRTGRDGVAESGGHSED